VERAEDRVEPGCLGLFAAEEPAGHVADELGIRAQGDELSFAGERAAVDADVRDQAGASSCGRLHP
jgi:hypothetical protein